MQVKKFEAPTMQEALKVIKRELGPDAIILSMKNIKSGFGLMSKASVEITAAVAEKDLQKKRVTEKNLPKEAKEKIWNKKAEQQSEIYDSYFEKQLKRLEKDKIELNKQKSVRAQVPVTKTIAQIEEELELSASVSQAAPLPSQQMSLRSSPIEDRMAEAAKKTPVVTQERRYIDIPDDEEPSTHSHAAGAQADISKVHSLEKDVEALKSMLAELATGATAREQGEHSSEISDEVSRAMRELVSAGIERKIARQIIRQASFDLNPEEQKDEQLVLDRMAETILGEIQVKDLLDGVGAVAGNAKTTIVSLVGPTGVGKTTTIAKIASLAILEKKLRVGLINLDSYKVAAADQLATYAKIMNVPFRSVNSKEELQQAIYDFSTLDIVFIDTTGRSQKDQENLIQLRHLLNAVEGNQCVLMMTATSKDSDLNEIVNRFQIFHPVGLVFSKLDETNVYGCIFNIHKKTHLPLLYFTVGQRVPEDIEKASPERVVDLILDL